MAFKFLLMPPQTDQSRAIAARVADSVPSADVVVAETLDDARREIVDADAALGTIPPDLLRHAENLRWLQCPAAGPPAGYYYKELIEHPVVVTNLRGIYGHHIAPHIMAFVLGLSRGFQTYIPQQVRREWSRMGEGSTVYLPEATALIIGVGGIGADAARLCACFGMHVIGVDPRREETPEGVSEMRRPDQLDALLPRADFVIMTVPHTPQTEGMMNASRFKLMKKTAFLINIGRGATLKLDDLVDALNAGEIAGAGLDVYEIEPLPEDHPLWNAPGVLLTPHRASVGPYTQERRADLVVDNCRRFAAGEPLRNVVDKENWF